MLAPRERRVRCCTEGEVELTDPAVVSATAVHSAEPIKPRATTNVTLVGDAIHTMPPMQGLGGSTALVVRGVEA